MDKTLEALQSIVKGFIEAHPEMKFEDTCFIETIPGVILGNVGIPVSELARFSNHEYSMYTFSLTDAPLIWLFLYIIFIWENLSQRDFNKRLVYLEWKDRERPYISMHVSDQVKNAKSQALYYNMKTGNLVSVPPFRSLQIAKMREAKEAEGGDWKRKRRAFDLGDESQIPMP